MIRIFDYLNVSTTNISSDSGFWVQANVIKRILESRSDFFFYLTIPNEAVKYAQTVFEGLEGIKLIPIKYTPRSAINKYFVDVEGIKSRFNWRKYYVNVIYSNEPYTLHVLVHIFKSVFPFLGAGLMTYIHWQEFPESNKLFFYKDRKYNPELWLQAGAIVFSDSAYVNSEYIRSLTLNYFVRFLRHDLYDEVSQKLKPLYIGVNLEELDKYKPDNIEKDDKPLIVFNLRMFQYTGATILMRTIRELVKLGYNKRFRVVFTNPTAHGTTSAYAQFAEKYKDVVELLRGGYSRPRYIKLLWEADYVFAWHSGVSINGNIYNPFNGWSIALLEGVASECYPIVHSNGFYPEMFPSKYLLPPDERSLVQAMINFIENVEHYRKVAKNILAPMIREKFSWDKLYKDWIRAFERAYNSYLARSSNLSARSFEKLRTILNHTPRIAWEELNRQMNWGHQIKWGRDALYITLTTKLNCRETSTPEPVFECTTTEVQQREKILEKIMPKQAGEIVIEHKHIEKRKSIIDFFG